MTHSIWRPEYTLSQQHQAHHLQDYQEFIPTNSSKSALSIKISLKLTRSSARFYFLDSHISRTSTSAAHFPYKEQQPSNAAHWTPTSDPHRILYRTCRKSASSMRGAYIITPNIFISADQHVQRSGSVGWLTTDKVQVPAVWLGGEVHIAIGRSGV